MKPMTPEMQLAVTALSSLTGGFLIYWFGAGSDAAKKYFLKNYGEARHTYPLVLFQRLWGFLWLGIVPAAIMYFVCGKSPMYYFMNDSFDIMSLAYAGGIAVLLVPINLLNAKGAENLKTYPQVRLKEWDTKVLVNSAITWGMYLLAYEFLFRGILLYSTVDAFGIVPAIAVNVALYSAVHIPKGAGEAFGAIPFGIAVCWCTLETGSIWTAFLAHLALAWSNEWASLRAHPEMRMKN